MHVKITMLASKIVAILTWAVGAVIFAMDPTERVALIVAAPIMVANVGTLILGFLARQDAKAAAGAARQSLKNQDAMKDQMDGHFSKLLAERKTQGDELKDVADRLAHAEGRREGMEAGESKTEARKLGPEDSPVKVTMAQPIAVKVVKKNGDDK